jgi:2-(3-amino-3-carboxypropyl)histidine synthase
LEAAMMANPKLKAYRYDPYQGRLFREHFDHEEMHRARSTAIYRAQSAKTVGLILGTLGRQGSVGVLESIRSICKARGIKTFTLLMSEIDEVKLREFGAGVDAWVQVACPRLSIDWGESYEKPFLSSFEAFTAWAEDAQPLEEGGIAMDYYSNEGGPWSNYTVDGGYGGTQRSKFWHMGEGKKLLKYE